MMRPLVAAVAAVAFTWPINAVLYAPVVHAVSGVECANRGKAHIEHHGGLAEDNRWHVMHAELPTCNPDHHDALSCTGIVGELEHDADDADDKLAGHCHESEHDADAMEQRAEQAEYDAERGVRDLDQVGRDAEHGKDDAERDAQRAGHDAERGGRDVEHDAGKGLHDAEHGGHDAEHDAGTVLHDVEHDGPGHHK